MAEPLRKDLLYRLRLLAERPRAYTTRCPINPQLERRGFARRTGRRDEVRAREQWNITDAGREALAQETHRADRD